MPGDGVYGQEHMRALRRQMEKAGQGDLRAELSASLRQAAVPLARAVDEAIPQYLPRRGGLAREVQGMTIEPVVGVTASTVRLKLRGRSEGRDVRRMDAGTVRHPVYGNRSTWVSQPVKPGFWTKTLAKQGSKVRKAIDDALRDFTRRLQ